MLGLTALNQWKQNPFIRHPQCHWRFSFPHRHVSDFREPQKRTRLITRYEAGVIWNEEICIFSLISISPSHSCLISQARRWQILVEAAVVERTWKERAQGGDAKLEQQKPVTFPVAELNELANTWQWWNFEGGKVSNKKIDCFVIASVKKRFK